MKLIKSYFDYLVALIEKVRMMKTYKRKQTMLYASFVSILKGTKSMLKTNGKANRCLNLV